MEAGDLPNLVVISSYYVNFRPSMDKPDTDVKGPSSQSRECVRRSALAATQAH